ncbi:hypothetical protein [Microbacterium stercoris]|uniref:Uncharacterized protein n=1 Tax=Microbacterium stercoris TaxID=2820289 RepID=A0A939QNC9_9MICO|nr:hypothetical protein [Microbacterium stercoris]MBO3662616.1 hypothetical protein [Microbacterium stercoris]
MTIPPPPRRVSAAPTATRSGAWPRIAPWLIGLGSVLAAWGLTQLTPPDSWVRQSFPVSAQIGEPAEGNNLIVTVRAVAGASELSDAHAWSGEGPWLLVTFDAQATVEEAGAYLERIELHIGERTFSPSERPSFSSPEERLAAGLPHRATAAFELREQDLGQRARLEFGYDDVNEELDSAILLDIDLAEISFAQKAEIADRSWSE